MQWTGGKESDKKNIKMRQRLDRDETLLLLATLKQGKSTLCCRFRSTRPIIDPLPPPLSSTISWTHRISSANASVLVVVVFVLIFLLQRLYRCHRFLGPVVYPLPPPLLSQIPLMCRVFSVLWQRLRCCCWVWGPILFFWLLRLWYQYPDPVNSPTPPHLETFNQTHCIFWFLNWRLCCRRRNLGLTVNTPTPLLSLSVLWDRQWKTTYIGLLTLYFFLCRFAPVTVGHGCLPNLVGDGTVENSWGAHWMPRLFYEWYIILWFEFDLCG